jgi:tetratricopeptide (TPR) repeat protein
MRGRAILSLVVVFPLLADQGVLVVHVTDMRPQDLARLQLRAEGGDVAAPTDVAGIARIPLSPQTKSGDKVGLQLVQQKDLLFLSPIDQQVIVPRFDSPTELHVVLVSREAYDVLMNSSSKASLAANSHQKTATPPGKILPKAQNDRPIRGMENYAGLFKTPGILAFAGPWLSQGMAFAQARSPKTEDGQRDGREADSAIRSSQSLYEQGKYRESERALQKAAELRPDDSIILTNWGRSLVALGDYPRAEPLLESAVAIAERLLGPDTENPLAATMANNLAELFRSEGDYARAEPLSRRALGIREKALGPDHPDTATSLNNLATLLYSKGDYAGAEPLFRSALAIDEKAVGTDHPGTATDLNNLAGLLYSEGDYQRAEPLYRRALAIDEKALGPDHPDTANSLDNLAVLRYSKGDYAAAEPLFRRALAIDEKALGPDHPDTANSLNNLAVMRYSKGDYAAAEPLYRRALAIRERALGPDHPDTATSLNNLAFLLDSKGDYAGAEPLYRRALDICEKALGPDHPTTQTVRRNLDEVLKKLGK